MPKEQKEMNAKASGLKSASEAIKKLTENTAQLQQVYVDLGMKIDRLSEQISGLLGLFESAAKSFAEVPSVHTAERDKEFITKINQLLEQDKIIAKGILYIEDKVNEISAKESPETLLPQAQPPILQAVSAAPPAPVQKTPQLEIPSAPAKPAEQYAPSIAENMPSAPQQARKPAGY